MQKNETWAQKVGELVRQPMRHWIIRKSRDMFSINIKHLDTDVFIKKNLHPNVFKFIDTNLTNGQKLFEEGNKVLTMFYFSL